MHANIYTTYYLHRHTMSSIILYSFITIHHHLTSMFSTYIIASFHKSNNNLSYRIINLKSHVVKLSIITKQQNLQVTLAIRVPYAYQQGHNFTKTHTIRVSYAYGKDNISTQNTHIRVPASHTRTNQVPYAYEQKVQPAAHMGSVSYAYHSLHTRTIRERAKVLNSATYPFVFLAISPAQFAIWV